MSQQRQGQPASAAMSGAPRYSSAADVRGAQRPQAFRQRSAEGELGETSRPGSFRYAPQEPRLAPPPLLADTISDTLQQLPPVVEWPSKMLSYLVVDPALAVLRIVIDVLVSPRTHRIVLRLGVLATLFWAAFALAIAAYVGFYRAWVPDIGLTRSVWLQYGQDTPPYAVIDLNIPGDKSMGLFAEDQEYDVSLDLIVPLSAANLDLGNFMVALELRSPLNHTVYYISKPSIIVHEPAPIRAMNNVMFQLTRQAPTLILPTSSPPVQLMTIPLLRRTILQPAHAAHPFAAAVPEGVSRAIVTVGRYDAERYWKYGGGHGVGGIMRDSGGILKAAANVDGFRSRGELQTHSASLRFDAHLTGLRYFMYHHPLASFLLFTALFMSFELLSALTFWAIAAFYTSNLTQPSLEIENNYYAPARRQGRPGRNNYPESDTDDAVPRPEYGEEGPGSDTVTGADSDYEDTLRDASRQARSSSGAERRGGTGSTRRAPSDDSGRHQQWEQPPSGSAPRGDTPEGSLVSPLEQPRSGSPYDDLPGFVGQPRRVLGRLDEETEEDTDARSTSTSAGWENVGDDDTQLRRFSPDEEELEYAQRRAQEGLRQRRGVKTDPEDEDDGEGQRERFARGSTIGGSASSQSSLAPSFGASLRDSTTPGTSSAAGPSRLPSGTPGVASAAATEIKSESSDEPEPELETDDSDEKRPAREAGSEDEGRMASRTADTSGSTESSTATESSSGGSGPQPGQQTPRGMRSPESSASD